jgi:hypothetical protein
VMAHVAELPRLRVLLVIRIVDGLGRPYPDVAIYSASAFVSVGARSRWRTSASGGKSLAIGRDMTTVDFEIFLFACSTTPNSQLNGCSTKRSGSSQC